jgi:RNA polymerase sigma factor (sigma-70 family)
VDRIARDRLILDNLPLAQWWANRQQRYAHGSISVDDLYQVACVGLIKAADTWNSGSAPFGVWATWKIRGEIRWELKRMGHTIKTSRGHPPKLMEGLVDIPDGLNHEPQSDKIEYADDALDHLTRWHRQMVMLHFGLVDGVEWPAVRIAEKMGCSHTTVDNHLHDAIEFLSRLSRRLSS